MNVLAARMGLAAGMKALVADGALIETRRPATRVMEADVVMVAAIFVGKRGCRDRLDSGI